MTLHSPRIQTMPSHRLPHLLLFALLMTGLAAQDQPRLVEGTVRDEAGAPIAGAHVRIEVCRAPSMPGVLAVELADHPLPHARSTTKGTFSLVMAPVHDRLDWEVHGRLALVVEAAGRQPWRELLPNPPSLFTGSDTVLPALRDADRATVRIESAPSHAFVRMRRIDGDEYLQEGGPPPREILDLAVPANGVQSVHVPLIPNPATVPCTDFFAKIGWTAQLVCPGRTSEPRAIFAGDVLTFTPPDGPATTQPALAATGARLAVARCLHRLEDGSLRWFPAVEGAVADDSRLPVVAVELADAAHRGLVVPWPGPVPELPELAPRELRCVDPAGSLVDDVRISLFAPDQLVWQHERVRPLLPASERLAAPHGTVKLPDSVVARPSAWITAPRHLPMLVLDVRTLPDGGKVVLQPAPRTVTLLVKDEQGRAIPGATIYSGPVITGTDGSLHQDTPWLRADGTLPRTDAEGRCELPACAGWPSARCTATGWQFGFAQFGEQATTMNVTGTRVQTWPMRAVSADGHAVPFANLGAEIWTYATDGSSYGHRICAMADSRGMATLVAASKKPPKVMGSELGGYVGKGTPLTESGTTDVVVAEDPFVAIVSPTDPNVFARYVMGWRGAGRSLCGSTRIPTAALFRWPATLPLWAHEASSGPPVVVTKAEARQGTPLVLDRRHVVRTTLLRLLGHVPQDLATLRTQPVAIAGCSVDGPARLDSDYLHPDREHLALQTRDEFEHRITILHPETLPTHVLVASGAAGRTEVTAELTRGAPCTLVVRLAQPMAAHVQVALEVRVQGKSKPFAVAFLHDPRFFTPDVTQGIELPTPFALPPGTLQVSLSPSDQKPTTVVVDGTALVRAEFAPKK